ncbi:GTP cyclohydrolase 1 [Collinsella intestinalis]|nr:GTP cyclohydrolase 1 [Collinsella intestinalis]
MVRGKLVEMVDQDKVREAVRLLLEGIGEDPTREGLVETPDRVARMYSELCDGMDRSASEHLSKTFCVSGDDLVIERDITFYSLCEHHMLPFYGKAAIGYIPDGRVAGLSKLARTVEVFARRLQLQEQLTAQVADALMEELGCKGAIVLMEAEHMCMTMRGVQKPGTKTATLARRGAFVENPELEARFFRMLGR